MSKKKGKAKSTTWADVRNGAVVVLAGREWTVEKIKPAGKTAKVKLARKGGHESKGEVRLKDAVEIARKGTPAPTKKSVSLYGPEGEQARWATKKELDEALKRTGLPAGDPEQTKPPAKATGDPWETQADRTEKMLDRLLGAHLVGEAKDEAQGYYVPPVDVSSAAAHLALFHGGIPEACQDDEGRMLAAHAAQHDAAKKGEGILAVNHWHTNKRPG